MGQETELYAYDVISRYLDGKGCLLRVDRHEGIDDGGDIETSEGARITIAEAKRIWPILKRRGDIKGERIGAYTAVGHNGTDDDPILKVGCHKIPFSEINYVAQELGLE